MAVSATGKTVGSIGGCAEAEVIQMARHVIDANGYRLMAVDMADFRRGGRHGLRRRDADFDRGGLNSLAHAFFTRHAVLIPQQLMPTTSRFKQSAGEFE